MWVIGGRGDGNETTWERYIKEKRQRKKEKKSKVKGAAAASGEGEEEEEEEGDGFDDPFFQHDVTTATAVSGRDCTCLVVTCSGVYLEV